MLGYPIKELYMGILVHRGSRILMARGENLRLCHPRMLHLGRMHAVHGLGQGGALWPAGGRSCSLCGQHPELG